MRRAILIVTMLVVAAHFLWLWMSVDAIGASPEQAATIRWIAAAVVGAMLVLAVIIARWPRPAVPPGGWRIPLSICFTGLRAVPGIAFTRNNLAPWLCLRPDGVEYGMRRRLRPFEQIERVDTFAVMFGSGVRFAWRNSPFTFGAVLKDPAERLRLLARLQQEGVPLGPAAQHLVAAHTREQAAATHAQ